MKQVGAVIVFKSGWGKVAAECFLSMLKGLIEPTTVHEFDPEEGGPVWYIPLTPSRT